MINELIDHLLLYFEPFVLVTHNHGIAAFFYAHLLFCTGLSCAF